MLFEPGYEYYTQNTIDSFMGSLKAEGYFVHDSETTYHGWVKILGKKRPLYHCEIIDGYYNYCLDAVGLKITIHAFVSEDHAINGYACARGKANMPVGGGAVRRVRIADGKTEKIGTWNQEA